MDDELRRAVMRHAGMGELEQLARKAGMRTMYEDGIVKALRGETTIEEVLRVTEDASREKSEARCCAQVALDRRSRGSGNPVS
jgi:hypothetical protein